MGMMVPMGIVFPFLALNDDGQPYLNSQIVNAISVVVCWKKQRREHSRRDLAFLSLACPSSLSLFPLLVTVAAFLPPDVHNINKQSIAGSELAELMHSFLNGNFGCWSVLPHIIICVLFYFFPRYYFFHFYRLIIIIIIESASEV